MNSRTISVKDEYSDFVVYYPSPCTQFPPMGTDIPQEGCQTLSIDPALKTFSLTIEKRHSTSYIETIYIAKLDLSPYGDVNETTGTTKVSPEIFQVLNNVLQFLYPLIYDCRFIVVERPLAKNYKTTRIYQHLLTYFSMIAPGLRYPCVVIDLSPKLKGWILESPKHLDYRGLKIWAIEKAIQLLSWRGSDATLQFILDWKKKGKLAASDPSDAIIQMEAFFKLMKGIETQQPIILTHY